MSKKRWFETRRKRNEEGRFVKRERPLLREAWGETKRLAAIVADFFRKTI